MMNVTITKDYDTGKANAQAKAVVTELITRALAEAFGEENVAMDGTSQVNEIGVRDTVDSLDLIRKMFT